MTGKQIIRYRFRKGAVLALVMVALIILTASGVGLMALSYGVRRDSVKAKNEAVSMLAAEAGYERAIFRMSQQPDLLSVLMDDDSDFASSETITLSKPDEVEFEDDDSELTGTIDYTISFNSFMGSRPVFKISSTGTCGMFSRTVDVYVVQAVSGWDMGMCRIPSGTYTTDPVNYITGEIIDMPLHINSYGDPYDSEMDIHIIGAPDFKRSVTMSESRYSAGGWDKYASVISLFDEGIYFLQPESRIMDHSVVQAKVDNFKSTLLSQKPQYILEPEIDEDAEDDIDNALPTVQLEFFVEDDVGKIRITNDCAVRGNDIESSTHDYKVDTDWDTLRFEKYHIYAYHYIPEDAEATGKRYTVNVTDTYVTPTYGGVEAEPGGQIFVDGNVIIGGNKTEHDGNQLVKGRITVAATGNIWIADSILVDGPHDADGMPSQDNSNVLGLVAQGVVKVIDPGLVEDYTDGEWQEVCEWDCRWERIGWSWHEVCGEYCDWEYVDSVPPVDGMVYESIGISDGSEDYDRILPQYTTVEAAITVGGGGWGAENVAVGYGDPGRKDHPSQDYLVVRGTITEVVRGVVGAGSDGYAKRYYLDERLLEGILPGDFYLRGKYIPSPAGWYDYRSQF